jgi:formylglycine-generating enzyme required for sulfatase activity
MQKVTFAVFVLSCSILMSAQPDRTLSHPMEGPRRMALVIGNNAYPWARLTNAASDARSLATALESAGFERQNITLKIDVNLRDMQRSIRTFVESIRSGDLAFVYYSGHGVEVRGKNYLLPVDFPSDSSELEVSDDAYSAQELLDKIDASGARVKLIVFDACRDNPLPVTKRSVSRGLGRMDGEGMLIMFATSAGKTATDSGVFQRELARGLQMPGISADDAFKQVARNVNRATGGQQTPAIYGLLLEDFAFVPGNNAAIITPEPSTPKPGPATREPEPPTREAAAPRRGDVRTNPKDGQQYSYIPPGTFKMGCSAGDNECHLDEKPVRDITLTQGYWLGQTEATVEAYRRYAKAKAKAMPPEPNFNGARNPGWRDGKTPIVNVSWDQSKSYCEWIGGRLPTEAEWEYAARAGVAGDRYGAPGDVAWTNENSGKSAAENSFHAVALKSPNGFGLYDMLGNVAEWVQDWYGEYVASDTSDPPGPPNGQSDKPLFGPPAPAYGPFKTLRGGSFYNFPKDARASARSRMAPSLWSGFIGFRCAWQ